MNLRLKTRILESRKPQIALAKELGVAEPVLSKIVNGWIDPKEELKARIAQTLNCEVADIFPENDRGVSAQCMK